MVSLGTDLVGRDALVWAQRRIPIPGLENTFISYQRAGVKDESIRHLHSTIGEAGCFY